MEMKASTRAYLLAVGLQGDGKATRSMSENLSLGFGACGERERDTDCSDARAASIAKQKIRLSSYYLLL